MEFEEFTKQTEQMKQRLKQDPALKNVFAAAVAALETVKTRLDRSGGKGRISMWEALAYISDTLEGREETVAACVAYDMNKGETAQTSLNRILTGLKGQPGPAI